MTHLANGLAGARALALAAVTITASTMIAGCGVFETEAACDGLVPPRLVTQFGDGDGDAYLLRHSDGSIKKCGFGDTRNISAEVSEVLLLDDRRNLAPEERDIDTGGFSSSVPLGELDGKVTPYGGILYLRCAQADGRVYVRVRVNHTAGNRDEREIDQIRSRQGANSEFLTVMANSVRDSGNCNGPRVMSPREIADPPLPENIDAGVQPCGLMFSDRVDELSGEGTWQQVISPLPAPFLERCTIRNMVDDDLRLMVTFSVLNQFLSEIVESLDPTDQTSSVTSTCEGQTVSYRLTLLEPGQPEPSRERLDGLLRLFATAHAEREGCPSPR